MYSEHTVRQSVTENYSHSHVVCGHNGYRYNLSITNTCIKEVKDQNLFTDIGTSQLTKILLENVMAWL